MGHLKNELTLAIESSTTCLSFLNPFEKSSFVFYSIFLVENLVFLRSQWVQTEMLCSCVTLHVIKMFSLSFSWSFALMEGFVVRNFSLQLIEYGKALFFLNRIGAWMNKVDIRIQIDVKRLQYLKKIHQKHLFEQTIVTYSDRVCYWPVCVIQEKEKK